MKPNSFIENIWRFGCKIVKTVTRFMRSVKKYTDITELTPELVREFMQKIVVYQAEKVNIRRTQRIDLYFNGFG